MEPSINRRAPYWVGSLLLAGVLLYYSLRGIEWARVWEVMRGARPMGVLLAAALISAALVIRALRWRVLLLAGGTVPVGLSFWATAIGYLGNNLLPARAGEVVRTVIVSRRCSMSKAFVLTTAFSERVIDALVLITISAAVLLTLPHRPGWFAAAAKPFAVLALTGVAAIALLPLFERFWCRVLAALPVPERLRHPVEQALCRGLEALRSLHSGRRLSLFLLLTMVIWGLDGITVVITAASIGVSINYPLALLLVAALGLGSALPSTPGYVGIYQFVAVTVLTPFGVSKTDAIAYILLAQALIYAVVLLWGGIGLLRQKSSAAPLRDKVAADAVPDVAP